MATHSPHPDSLSPHGGKAPVSAFQWPIPPSPSNLKPTSVTNLPDITVKEILDKYQDDPELLKYILSAKAEEDKKRAAKDTLKAEEARIQLKQMDLDLAREQTKAQARYERHAPPPPVQYGYYSLAPVQQQVLARFQQPPPQHPHHPQYQQQHPHQQQQQQQQHHAQHYSRPPPSPAAASYPHSAHPLCPPTTVDERSYRLQPSHYRQSSPSPPPNSASVLDTKKSSSLKRNRSSISTDNPSSTSEDKLSHNKVMEALKAKIQRGGAGPMSPLGPPSASSRNDNISSQPLDKKKKLNPCHPTINVTTEIEKKTMNSTSPRSAKPYLPPIDTNLGRMDNNNHHLKNGNNGSSSDSSDTTTTTSSGGDDKGNDKVESQQQEDKKEQQKEESNVVNSPSDHILVNTRRARSLSPSPAKKS